MLAKCPSELPYTLITLDKTEHIEEPLERTSFHADIVWMCYVKTRKGVRVIIL